MRVNIIMIAKIFLIFDHIDYINDDHHQDYNAKKMHLVFILTCRSGLDIGVKVGVVVLTWDREKIVFTF